MDTAAVRMPVSADMTPFMREFEVAAQQSATRLGATIQKSLNSFSRLPLGNISRDFNQFNGSLDAATSRVLAFSAAAGSIFVVQRAIQELTKSTIEVEKSLADINVILNQNADGLQRFGSSLFSIAKQTGQSFQIATKAAVEFSRQGLGVEETLKRTKDALILTRISGMEVAESTKAITTAINAFSKEVLSSTDLVNKFAAVDASFSLSSKDLAEAVGKVGSSAQDAGVSLDQLLGIVAAVAQRTGQSGNIIGNAFRTIFQRLSRVDTLDKLERMGMAVRDVSGEALPAITILGNLAEQYDNLSGSEKSFISEISAGLFQLNRFKAVIQDLSKGTLAEYVKGTNLAANATSEATDRSERLNETLSANLNKTYVNLTQAAAKLGQTTINPAVRGFLNTPVVGINPLLETFIGKEGDSKDIGSKIGKGIMEGLGEVLTGPAFVMVGIGLLLLIKKLSADAMTAFKSVLGLNNSLVQQQELQKLVTNELIKQGGSYDAVRSGALSVLSVQDAILNSLRQQVILQETAAAITPAISRGLTASGFNVNRAGAATRKTPIFADPERVLRDAILREQATGINPNEIRVGSDRRLVSPDNPMGLGVYNTRDEPLGLGQGIDRANRLGIDPRKNGVPTFADPLKSAVQLAMEQTGPQSPQSKILFPSLANAFRTTELETKRLNNIINEVSSSLSSLDKRNLFTLAKNVDLFSEELIQPKQISYSYNPDIIAAGARRRDLGYQPTVFQVTPQRLGPPPLNSLQQYQNDLRYSTTTKTLNEIQNQRSSEVERRVNLEMVNFKRNLLGLPGSSSAQIQLENIETQRMFKEMRESEIRQKRISELKPRASGIFGRSALNELRGLDPTSAASAEQLSMGKIQNFALVSALVAPIISSVLSQFVGSPEMAQTRNGRLLKSSVSSIGDVASMTSLGTMLGAATPVGPLGGAALGGGLGVVAGGYRAMMEWNNILPEFDKNLENSRARLSQVNDMFARLTQTTNDLSEYQLGNMTPGSEKKLFDRMTSLIVSQPEGTQRMMMDYFKSGDIKGMDKLKKIMVDPEELSMKKDEFLSKLADLNYADRKHSEPKDMVQSLLNIPSVKEKLANPNVLNQLKSATFGGDTSFFMPGPGAGGGYRTTQFEPGNVKPIIDVLSAITGADAKETEGFAIAINKLASTKESAKELENIITILTNAGGKIATVMNEIEKNSKNWFNNKKALMEFTDVLNKIGIAGEQASRMTLISLKGFSDISLATEKGILDIKKLSLTEYGGVQAELPFLLGQNTEEFQFKKAQSFSALQNKLSGSVDKLLSPEDFSSLSGPSKPIGGITDPMFWMNQLPPETLKELGKSNLFDQIKNLQSSIQDIGKPGGIQNTRDIIKDILNIPEAKQDSRIDLRKKLEDISNALDEQEGIVRALNKEEESAAALITVQNRERKKFIQKQMELQSIQLKENAPIERQFLLQSLGRQLGVTNLQNTIAAGQGGFTRQLQLNQILPEFANLGLQRQSGLFDISSRGILGRTNAQNQFKDSYEGLIKDAMEKASLASNATEKDKIVSNIEFFKNKPELFASQANKFDYGKESPATGILNQLAVDIQKKLDERKNNIAKINSVEQSELDELEKQLEFRRTFVSETEKLAKLAHKQGILFADELRQAISNASTERIRKGEGGLSDITSGFTSQFTFGAQDAMLNLKTASEELGQTMKQGFKDSFKEFVMGAKNAQDALRGLGMVLAEKLLDKSVDFSFNSLFGGLSSMGQSFFAKKNAGGLIKGYAGGGFVNGGSGVKDDVPAMLGRGEFVVRKPIVNKYGPAFFAALNGGGLTGFATGGSANIALRNRFLLNDPYRPVSGINDINPALSNFALGDESNPQNSIRQDTESALYQYLQDKAAYDATVAEALRAFKKQKSQRLMGAYINAAVGIAGAGLMAGFSGSSSVPRPTTSGSGTGTTASGDIPSFNDRYATIGSLNTRNWGGLMGFAGGGMSTDNIPALLTGGEFVIKKPMVDRLGVNFLNKLNQGGISRFQDGGVVGGNPNTNATNATSQQPQINIYNTFSTTVSKDGSSKTDTTTKSDSNNQTDQEKMKKFNEKMEATSRQVIITESKPGGLLYEIIKRQT